MRVTDRDRRLLEFVALHRLVLADHVRALLGVSAEVAGARLRLLAAAGFLSRAQVFHRQPACFQITRQGLALIGGELPAPRIDLRCYGHDVGVAWLWLAARTGAFGAMREVIAERQLRSHDGGDAGRDRPLGVRLGATGPGGRERLHYPDLLLVSAEGRRIALELELTPKGRTRRERILAAYAADARVDAVLYLVERRSIARSVQASARRLGISDRVHVQPVRLAGPRPRSEPSVAMARRREPGRAGGFAERVG
jgi:hypothetical protein